MDSIITQDGNKSLRVEKLDYPLTVITNGKVYYINQCKNGLQMTTKCEPLNYALNGTTYKQEITE